MDSVSSLLHSGQANIPLPRESRQNWQGIESNKWSLPERRHLQAKDQINSNHQAQDNLLAGRKHFEATNSGTWGYKSTIRNFPDKANRETVLKETITTVKKPFEPTRRPEGHKERVHIQAKPTGHFNHNRTTTRVFPEIANKTSEREATLEKAMGRKTTIEYLDDQRNNLPLTSLGDKSYKNPEYSTQFFKDGGLVAGSSMRKRKPKADALLESTKLTYKSGRMTAKDKEAKEVIDEDKKAVFDIRDWEQNTLKEANPKWHDPDAVELETPKKVETKGAAATKGKKAGKK